VEEKRLLRLGGTSIILAGILVAATLPLIPLIIPSLAPTSTQAGLVALESQGLIYGVTWVLYLVSDLLFLVVFFALYRALGPVRAVAAKVALVMNTIFVIVDVGLDIPLRLWLILLSSAYGAAPTNAQQTLNSASFAISASNQVALVVTFLQFGALIMASYLMRKSPSFGGRPAYLGFATGIVAMLFIPAFLAGSMLSGLFNIVGFVLLFFWSVVVGLKLRKLSKA
jgi:hypothetical protein